MTFLIRSLRIKTLLLLHLCLPITLMAWGQAKCYRPNILTEQERELFKAFLIYTYRKDVVRCPDSEKPCDKQAGHDEIVDWLSKHPDRTAPGYSHLHKASMERLHCDFGDGIGERRNINPPEVDIRNEGPIYVWGFDMKTRNYVPLFAESANGLDITNAALLHDGKREISTQVPVYFMAGQLKKRMNKDADLRVSEQEWVNYFVRNWRK